MNNFPHEIHEDCVGVPGVRYSYTAYNLRIISEVRFPELIESPGSSAPDVLIRKETLTSPDATNKIGGAIWKTDEGIYLYWREIGLFLIKEGREVLVDLDQGASEESVRLVLLGSVLGILLHERGLFTLHASAVSIQGKAIAFVGEKGAGKSTMAASLNKAGHPLLVDDILAIEFDIHGRVQARSGFPQFKLWPASVEALGEDPTRLSRLHPELDKRALRLDENFQVEKRALDRIYVLCEGPALNVQMIPPNEGLVELISHSYSVRFLGDYAAGENHFHTCKKLASTVPMYRLQRPRDLSKLHDVSAFIERSVS